MKKLLKIVGIILGSFAFIILCGIVVLNVFIDPPIPNPYKGQELTITPLPSTYKLAGIQWGAPEVERMRQCYPPIPNFDVEGCIHYTNVDTVNDYQFAQVGRTIESGAPRLFWRNSGDWKELKVPMESFYTEGFVEKNKKIYLVTLSQEGCGEDYCIYLIDLESGKSEKQPPASTMEISPDKKKAAFIVSHGKKSWKVNHTVVVWDVESDVRTPLATITEADPGSGRSFDYAWSTDSNLLRIKGSLRLSDDMRLENQVREFLYIYDHSKKKLFKS